jgi:opacity protein-like surface antigen
MYVKQMIRGAALAGCLFAAQAQAVPLFIDFTSAQWSSAHGAATASSAYGALDITLSSGTTAPLTFNAGDAPSPTLYTSFLALDGDGIAIGDDEIGAGESLGVQFSAPSISPGSSR